MTSTWELSMVTARALRRLGLLATLAIATAGSAVAPELAHAGSFTVYTCSAGVGNGAFAHTPDNGFVASYSTGCAAQPYSGVVVRNSGGPNAAPGFTSGAAYAQAPAGSAITGISFVGNLHRDQGWQVGLFNYSTNSWVWCGTSCWTTFGLTSPFSVSGFWAGQLGALVVCGASSCPRTGQYALLAMTDIRLTITDVWNPGVAISGGDLTAGGWRRGVGSMSYSAWDNTGIKAARFYVDGVATRDAGFGCNWAATTPCANQSGVFPLDTRTLSDGRHVLTVHASDAGDNVSGAAREVYVDNTPPGQPEQLELRGGDGWRSANRFALSWVDPQPDAGSPVAAVELELCPNGVPWSGKGCVRQSRPVTKPLIDDLAVPKAGEWNARAWLRDAAGNQDPERAGSPLRLRLDQEAPELAFAEPDPDDPVRVRVVAEDATSGLAGGTIEAQRQGETAWRPLPTEVAKPGLTAVLGDELLPDGAYSLRARAVDRAGNERTSDRTAGGKAAQVSLPVRIKTRLAVGKPKKVRAKRSRRGKRRYRRVLVVRPRARYGETIRLSGRLTSPGANPLVGVPVEIFEQIRLPGAPWQRIGSVTTSGTGRFVFKALRGPGRVLRFRYPGTPTIRPRQTEVELRVKALTTLRVSDRSVVNGETVTFRGRLAGGPIPTGGKLVALQVWDRRKWRTFANPRANASGYWEFPYRFDGTRGYRRYRFRALVPREPSYPYWSGKSRKARVTVRGL